MVFKDFEVKRSLTKKGFKKEPEDHWYYVLYVDGKRTKVKTHTSHCGQDIGEHLINAMKKQLHLNKKEFADLINCPLSYEEYVSILRQRDVIK